jgi:hypothetical protein
MESSPRQEAYICRATDDGQVVVFARCDKEIRIYEADYTEKISKITLDEWGRNSIEATAIAGTSRNTMM